MDVGFDIYELEDKREFKKLNLAIIDVHELMVKSGLNDFEISGVLQREVGNAIYKAGINKDFNFDEKKMDYDAHYYFMKYAREHIRETIGSISDKELFGRMITEINSIISDEKKMAKEEG